MRLLAKIGQLKTCRIEWVVLCTKVIFILKQQVERQTGDACLDLVVQNEIRIEELRPEMCLAGGIGQSSIGHPIGAESARRRCRQSRTSCATWAFARAGLHRKGAGLEDRIGIVPLQQGKCRCSGKPADLQTAGNLAAYSI